LESNEAVKQEKELEKLKQDYKQKDEMLMAVTGQMEK